MPAAPRVAIVGAGGVGTTLGRRLAAAHHPLRYGVRDLARAAQSEALQSPEAQQLLLPVPDAVGWADVVILSVPGFRTPAAAGALAASLGPGAAGKVVIDATNPLSPWPKLEVLHGATSAGEMLQDALPESFVFKAFNTIGLEHMAHPSGEGVFGGGAAAAARGPLTMLFAGAPEKREAAAAIISAVGFAPRYVGPIRYARNLESLAELWIHCGIGGAGLSDVDWGRDFAFQVVGGRGG